MIEGGRCSQYQRPGCFGAAGLLPIEESHLVAAHDAPHKAHATPQSRSRLTQDWRIALSVITQDWRSFARFQISYALAIGVVLTAAVGWLLD